MAVNQVFKTGNNIALPAPSGLLSGQPVRIGAINAVAVTDRGDATTTISLGGGVSITQPTGGVSLAPTEASVKLDGAYNLTVTGAVAAAGDLVYITGANTLTTTASGNKVFGYALRTKGAGAGIIPVLLVQTGNDTAAA